jgi:TATA-box binding protein (TBP) (component of TFIID and TFIIIB)
MKQVTASVFSTGKIIVTGAETLKEIAYAYNIINQHILSQAKTIKVDKVENPDLFDVVLGYKFHDMVKELTLKGFKPWAYVNKNYQINF